MNFFAPGRMAETSLVDTGGALPECVYLVDDDEAVRMTLTYMLSSAGFAVRPYDSAEAFLRDDGDRNCRGCLLTDVCMPGMGGVDLIQHLSAHGCDMPVVVISGQADIPLAVDAMKAGAADFLQKPVHRAELMSAVGHAMARKSRQARPDAEARRLVDQLSPRQRQVLEGVAAGKLNKVIAHDLGLSVRTVEDYRLTIMARTGARSAGELVRLAVAAGF